MTVTYLVGDVRARLRELPDQHFDCVVTSPPYWGLRDYGTATWVGGDPACDHRSPTMREGRQESRATLAGSVATNRDQLLLAHRSACGRCGAVEVDAQIGLEPTLGEHLAVMVDVFREVRRVLKLRGTLWLNYGDCYAAQPNGRPAADVVGDDRTFRDKPFSTVGPIYNPNHPSRANRKPNVYGVSAKGAPSFTGRVEAGGFLKPKDLCMIPNRLAIALQDDGWWVRSEIIWHKPNPMPESVYDRPTCVHEKVWLLTRGEDYFYNDVAIREPVTGGAHRRAAGPNSRVVRDRTPVSRKGPKDAARDGAGLKPSTRFGRGAGWRQGKTADPGQGVRNNTSFNEGRSDLVESRNARNVWTIAPKAFREAHSATFPPALAERCILAGVPAAVCALCGHSLPAPACHGACRVLPPVPGRVLDPFGGAGTVGLVADRLGLDATLIELSPAYSAMAERRILAARGSNPPLVEMPEAAE